MSDGPAVHDRRDGREQRDHHELAADIFELLGDRCIAAAESVTSGRIVESLATAEHASERLRGGLVAYQEAMKRRFLGVVADLVISPAAAVQMAKGAASMFDAEVTIATTGAAGGVDTDGHPVGTVFIATVVDGRADVREHHFEGPPERICEQARDAALADLLGRLRSSAV